MVYLVNIHHNILYDDLAVLKSHSKDKGDESKSPMRNGNSRTVAILSSFYERYGHEKM